MRKLKALPNLYLAILFALASAQAPIEVAPTFIALMTLCVLPLLKRLDARMRIVIYTSIMLIGSLTLGYVAGPVSPLMLLPAVVCLDEALREHAPQSLSWRIGATSTLKALLSTFTIMLLVAAPLSSPSLAVASALMLVYLIMMYVRSLRLLRSTAIEADGPIVRVVAGEEVEASSRLGLVGSCQVHLHLRPSQPWMEVSPTRATLGPGEHLDLAISLKPPLAAPIDPKVDVLMTDSRALSSLAVGVIPLELHVIPRAEYARHLARRLLEGILPGLGAQELVIPRHAVPAKGGVEYHACRPYMPGDSLRDVDWKKSVKLRELIIKERCPPSGSPAVIFVCLTARDEEEADKLSCTLVMASITTALESIQTALIAYDDKSVVFTSGAGSPIEALKKAIVLSERCLLYTSPSPRDRG